jgi:hypothetical protein
MGRNQMHPLHQELNFDPERVYLKGQGESQAAANRMLSGQKSRILSSFPVHGV